MEHQYEIHFNRGGKQKTAEYDYGGTKGIRLSVIKQNASIRFKMSALKSVDDLTSFSVKLVRDAFRKVYLIHALMYNAGLHVTGITVVIDGKATTLGRETPDFPFMFSMIQNQNLGLHGSWQSIVEAVVSNPKTAMDEDLRFAAVFSYLQSKRKTYAIDKFANLWTAMNALYTWIAGRYEQGLRYRHHLPDDIPLHQNLVLVGKDADSISALAWLICPQYKKLSRDELNKLWSHFYDTERQLTGYSNEDIEKLYEDSLRYMRGESVQDNRQAINRCAERFCLPLYTYLLLIYPYHWRCNFFHGNRTTILFAAYNDYEIAVLHTVNYYLDRFLNKEIPRLFAPDYWTEEKQDAVETFMKKLRPKDFEKALSKMLAQCAQRSQPPSQTRGKTDE